MMPGGSDASIDLSSVWCAIPVFNNAATILDIARQCREQLGHVIVVDDGSTDANLSELLASLDITVLRHANNRGKGQALFTAFGHAKQSGAEYLITLDGDGQHFPADIPRFFSHLSPDTIVIGAREEISGQMPRSSRFGREFSDFWIRLEAGGSARDTQSGFRAYPLPAVMQLTLRSHFYNFEMEIITKALWAGLRTAGVPIRVWYPPAQQRVSSFDPFRDNLRISLLHTRLVLRQLLPIPHRKIITERSAPVSDRPEGGAVSPLQKNTALRAVAKRVICENSSPIALAVCAALSILMGVVLWPLGILPVAYVSMRLHLNKVVALMCVVLCLPPIVPRICEKVGRVIASDAHPRLQWIVGSHVVAIPAAILMGWFVFELQSRAVSARSGAARPGSVGSVGQSI